MYSDLMGTAQQKREVAILLRLFADITADDAAFYLNIAEHYCRYPWDRTEVVATATKLLSCLEAMISPPICAQ